MRPAGRPFRFDRPNRRAHLRGLLLAVLLSIAGTGLAQPADAVIEPRSNTPFPVSLVPPGGSTEQGLTGTGLREVMILFIGVHVYAFGLYVDADGARATLAEFAGRSPAELAGDERFYRRLLELEFAMSLRLVMVRTVAGVDVAKRVRRRIAAARHGGLRQPAATWQALERFRGYFAAPEIATGTEVVFACTPSGRLSTTVAGDEQKSIDSRVMCRALFDVYLGEEPISVEGRKTVIAGFPELLAHPSR